MEIRFISSLTPDDENRIASAVLVAVGRLLEDLPIAYMLKIETVSGAVLHHTHAPVELRRVSPDAEASSDQGIGIGA
ncbi:MAG: hypothetical protein EHM13_01485 [Acidobacteria bacterium]|nr:MAG: hypothetical protein EHM13_01485 [Acidobacteriota bacterium]